MKGKINWKEEEVAIRLESLDIHTINYFKKHFLRSWENDVDRLRKPLEGQDDFLIEQSVDYNLAMYILCVNAGQKLKNAIFGHGPIPDSNSPA